MTEDFQALAARAEAVIGPANLTSKRMFGGITFLLNGNMLCCASRRGLMVRVGAAAEARALASPDASPCRVTGRPMPGFIMVKPEGLDQEADLARWIAMARAYVETLPPKAKKAHKPNAPSSQSSRKRRNASELKGKR
jgi:TfoX/Sxy family transcriptional regulator of competence genes